jgi:hypothetical protein
VIPLSPGMYLRLAAAGAVLALAAWTHWQAYSAGRDAADDERQAAILEAAEKRAEALEKLAAANGRMLEIERDAADRIAKAQARTVTQVKTVERVIRENPDFAAVVRPADLQRVRDDDLAAIAEAARRSAELSEASLRGVRGADTGPGSNAR